MDGTARAGGGSAEDGGVFTRVGAVSVQAGWSDDLNRLVHGRGDYQRQPDQVGAVDKAIPVLENALIAEDPKLEVIVSLAEIYEERGDVVKAMRLNKLAISRLMRKFR